jgi:hypothetical protein
LPKLARFLSGVPAMECRLAATGGVLNGAANVPKVRNVARTRARTRVWQGPKYRELPGCRRKTHGRACRTRGLL